MHSIATMNKDLLNSNGVGLTNDSPEGLNTTKGNDTILKSMIKSKVDVLENEIKNKYPDVLETLLFDRTTRSNILWATDNYKSLGNGYEHNSSITTELITGTHGNIILPRSKKKKSIQQARSRDMAEVFTPSWVCNAQNNLIDNAWFGCENVFNTEKEKHDGTKDWEINRNKVVFPKGKTWKHYIKENRLEVACGEAPYITSRYDTTTGEFISVENRIGLLDRKLRVINENIDTSGDWLEAAQIAYKSIYAFEWQGDNLLLAREAMLVTFIENYLLKFGKEPLLKSIKYIAYIISWNVWQMDGLKGVVPYSCKNQVTEQHNLFGDIEKTIKQCEGCTKENITKHNGVYCIIRDWNYNDPKTGKKGRKIKFIELLQRITK